MRVISLSPYRRRVYLASLRNAKEVDKHELMLLTEGEPSRMNTLIRKIKNARGNAVSLTDDEAVMLTETLADTNDVVVEGSSILTEPGLIIIEGLDGEQWHLDSPTVKGAAMRELLKQQDQKK